MSEWRSDLVDAVDELLKLTRNGNQSTWRRLGKVTPLPEPGWFAYDLRAHQGRPLTADSFDRLCLSDEKGPEHGVPISVERAQITDGHLRLKVTGEPPKSCRHLWTTRLTPQHLLRKLSDGIKALDDAPLADKLAARTLDPIPSRSDNYPPGFLPTQRHAYRACTTPGLHAVWGPPGTGKTRVLARSIEDLVRAGKRVLLVSTANIAVDNALNEVIKHLEPAPGQVVRVGTPHLSDLAANDDVLLDRLAARATAELDAQRTAIHGRLAELDTHDTRLHDLDSALTDYDHAQYLSAEQRIANTTALRARRVDLEAARNEVRLASEAQGKAQSEFATAAQRRADVETKAVSLRQALEMASQLARYNLALESIRDEVAQLRFQVEFGSLGWWKRRGIQKRLAEAEARLDYALRHVVEERGRLEPRIRLSQAEARPVTEDLLGRLDHDCAVVKQKLAAANRVLDGAHRLVREIEGQCARIEQQGIATKGDHDLVDLAKRTDLPSRHLEREELRASRDTERRTRSDLEVTLRDLDKRAAKLRRDAEGEVLAEASVVATTLARSRAHPAVARQRFDVVLVDEAGAAVVGEVLLAVSMATTTATLLGDFLQLGPVTAEAENVDKPSVQRWMIPDGFTHCGIRSPEDLRTTPGCAALHHQFRFGPNLRELANDVVYRVLADGVTEVTGTPPDDTEIVLVDVRGLPELTTIRRSGPVAGWWPVGALLSRALVQHHAAEGEVGVVTTFKQQVEATQAVLRDGGRDLDVAVGTAHTVQGREFETVVFDLVEDGEGWISAANWDREGFARNGVRLFGVGITRARKRLYIIVDLNAALAKARQGTPLAALRALGKAGKVQYCRASVLLGMAEQNQVNHASSVEAELDKVLRGLVDVTDIHDEFSFDEALPGHLAAARHSVWMWSPWVGKKSAHFLPRITDAVQRGVDVRVFIRTERDRNLMRDAANKNWVEKLYLTGAKVIRAELEHRKIVVIDDRVVLLGSHNPLSQHKSREMMITCQGAAFAQRILTDMNAQLHGNPPPCPTCHRAFELWRSANKRKGTPYFWRCHPCKTQQDIPRNG
ncbi:AAA domain-containing protein [Actinokineospora diospyrosa]|uniref:AAA domain-containing protein n=1 Tax=Actinokineospora diospyrosa TaxID=103728 RepID=A0ABT1ICB2_9PSEU|nr:AAA domain-containing protein [Actinokineospora diospyrosa]MCP2270270.1 AAA domain-containing protein [Actinokineospora diospyrosa]